MCTHDYAIHYGNFLNNYKYCENTHAYHTIAINLFIYSPIIRI